VKYDALLNLANKKRNWELIRKTHELKPTETSKKLLKQAEDDLAFAIDMLLKNEDGDR